MGIISQILYVADFAEPTRTHKEAEVARELAYIDLKRAVHYVARTEIVYLLEKGVLIHPNTLHTYNSTLKSGENLK